MPMVFLGKLAYTQLTILYCCGSILVPPSDLQEQWFDYYVSQLRICLSAEGAQNFSQPWVSHPRMGQYDYDIFDKFAYVQLTNLHCYGSIPVPYDDWEEWQFDYSASQLWFCWSVEGTKNLSWSWVSPLREWDSMTVVFVVKCGYVQLNIL